MCSVEIFGCEGNESEGGERAECVSALQVLYLRDCSTVKSADEEVNRENAFRVDTPTRVFFLVADSCAEKESWIGQIGRQMVRPSVLTEYSDD